MRLRRTRIFRELEETQHRPQVRDNTVLYPRKYSVSSSTLSATVDNQGDVIYTTMINCCISILPQIR